MLASVQNQNSFQGFELTFRQNTYNLKRTANNEDNMKHFMIFGILIVSVFVMGLVSTVDAHPHGTIDLMESHSHDIHDEKFQESFLIHTFEEVLFSMVNFINNILLG